MTPGKSYNICPIQNCQSSEWTLCFSMHSMRAHAKQSTNRKISGNVSVTPQLIGRYKEMSVWHQVNLTIYPPPHISDRAQSDVFTVQCCHWHSKTDIPPTYTGRPQSDLFTVQSCHWDSKADIHPPVLQAANQFNC